MAGKVTGEAPAPSPQILQLGWHQAEGLSNGDQHRVTLFLEYAKYFTFIYIYTYIYIYMGLPQAGPRNRRSSKRCRAGNGSRCTDVNGFGLALLWWCLTELIYEQCVRDACEPSRMIVRRLSCVSAAGKKSIPIHSTRRAAVRCWGPGTVGESPSGKTMRAKEN